MSPLDRLAFLGDRAQGALSFEPAVVATPVTGQLTLQVPVHTLAGVLQADFRVPSVSYAGFLRACRVMTRDETEVLRAFERAAFNVLFNNRDDHPKNLAFRRCAGRRPRGPLAAAARASSHRQPHRRPDQRQPRCMG